MLLTYMDAGESGIISKVTNKRLESMGLLPNVKIEVLSKSGGNFIIKTSNSENRLTITRDMAKQVNIYGSK
jgi:Fe2+ transport system protein FeoA